MVKSITLFIVVFLILLFSLSNVHHIQMRFVTGDPFHVRLIYLLLFSYLLGVLSATYFFILARLRARRKKALLEKENRDDEEEEEFLP